MAMQAKKMPMKKAPAEKPQSRPKTDGGPPKHLAYITEEEAKILDMILTIKKGAKGKDGKPLPQTYEPGQGSPTEFLTELTPQQINELLAKTDGKSETTPQGVESYAMFSENSSTTGGLSASERDASYGGTGTTSSSTTSRDRQDGTGESGLSRGSTTSDMGSTTSRDRQDGSGEIGESRGGDLTSRTMSRDRQDSFGDVSRKKDTSLKSGAGKSNRENVSTLTQTGNAPFNSSIPSSSELGRVVSGPGKTSREAGPVAPDPSIAGRLQQTRTTTINRDPNGPGVRRTVDTGSELGRLAVNSQFNTPLADNPGAYNESELANAITGEKPRAIGATTFDNVSRVVSDPTSTMITNPNIRQSLGDQIRPAIAQPKVDREPGLAAPVAAPGKTNRVRSIIMGNEPVPKSNVLPFRNGVPDSSLSPLTTLTPPANDDLITSPSPEERKLMPSQPAPAPSPVSRSSLQGLTTSPDTSGSGEFIDPQMPDISFDANQPSGTLFDSGTQEPEIPTNDGGGDGGVPTVIAGGNEPGTGPQPGPGPAPGPTGPEEYLPGIMPWDRADYEEIAAAYEAAGQTYTPQQFMAAFYNSQPFTIERPPPTTDDAAEPVSSVERFPGVMPWDRTYYTQLRNSYAAAGQTYTPEQFVTQFYSTPQRQQSA